MTDVDSSLASHAPGLTSSHRTQHCPVEHLPVELIIHIFHQCERGIKTALTLSHTCRRWRAVALDVGSLWTTVDIYIHPDSSTRKFNAFISRLGMQLDRTGQLPLEVFWRREGSDSQNGIIDDLIRRKGHFSRWKSLEARFEYHPQDAQPVFYVADIFENLEYLEVLSSSRSHPAGPYEDPLLQVIDRSVTSKFHTLYLRPLEPIDKTFRRLYGNIMEQARTLILDQEVSIRQPLPAGITKLILDSGQRHPLPYVETYILRVCIFSFAYPIDLQRLTSLTVDDLFLLNDTVLLLPSLQSITFGIKIPCNVLSNLNLISSAHVALGQTLFSYDFVDTRGHRTGGVGITYTDMNLVAQRVQSHLTTRYVSDN